MLLARETILTHYFDFDSDTIPFPFDSCPNPTKHSMSVRMSASGSTWRVLGADSSVSWNSPGFEGDSTMQTNWSLGEYGSSYDTGAEKGKSKAMRAEKEYNGQILSARKAMQLTVLVRHEDTVCA